MNEEVTARVHENEPEEGLVRNECWAVWVVRLSKFFGCLGISISAGVQVVLVFSCCLGAQVNQSYVSFRFLGRADVRVHVHVNAAVKVQIIVQLSMRM